MRVHELRPDAKHSFIVFVLNSLYGEGYYDLPEYEKFLKEDIQEILMRGQYNNGNEILWVKSFLEIATKNDYTGYNELTYGVQSLGKDSGVFVFDEDGEHMRVLYITGKQNCKNAYEQNKKDFSGGIKESEEKLRYELDWEFVQAMAKRMGKNKSKYPRDNWKKPIDIVEIKDALVRHFMDVMIGNYEDDGEEYGHLEAIALNAMILRYQLKHNR